MKSTQVFSDSVETVYTVVQGEYSVLWPVTNFSQTNVWFPLRETGSSSGNLLWLLLCTCFLWTLRPLLGAQCQRVSPSWSNLSSGSLSVNLVWLQSFFPSVFAASSVDSLSSPTGTTWPSLRWRPSVFRPERWVVSGGGRGYSHVYEII